MFGIEYQRDGSVIVMMEDGTQHQIAKADQVVMDAAITALVANLPQPVPSSVTMAQCRVALSNAGLLDQVTAAATTAGGVTLIAWDYATTIERASPTVATLASVVGLSGTQIDDLFRSAAQVTF